MDVVLDSLDAIVSNVSNQTRVREESDLLAINLAKFPPETIRLQDFEACMLASLRVVLGKQWSSVEEEAWLWVWENISGRLQDTLALPAVYERALSTFLDGLNEKQTSELHKGLWPVFFRAAPAAEDRFVVSKGRLEYISRNVVAMALDIYRDPKRVAFETVDLGVRHVGYGSPLELFPPFVTACVTVLQNMEADAEAVAAYRWSLDLVARMLVRQVGDGSTVVMKAINANSAKQMRKALASAPRGERAKWVLDTHAATKQMP